MTPKNETPPPLRDGNFCTMVVKIMNDNLATRRLFYDG